MWPEYAKNKTPAHCFKCGYDWEPKVQTPLHCPQCNTTRWDTPTFQCLCMKCGHQWKARTMHPALCPGCISFLWYTPRNKRGKDLFDSLVREETDDCIVWPRSVIGGGYGRFTVKHKTFLVHRLAYEVRTGPIPKDMEICHSCDNPPCMNYRHLFLGTEEDNREDKVSKLRHSYGEKHGMAKLTEDLVRRMREEYVFGSSTKGTSALAVKYGLHQTTVYDIVTRKLWKHI